MPGYCVAGTIGHKILSGQRKIELENRQTVNNCYKLPFNTYCKAQQTSLNSLMEISRSYFNFNKNV